MTKTSSSQVKLDAPPLEFNPFEDVADELASPFLHYASIPPPPENFQQQHLQEPTTNFDQFDFDENSSDISTISQTSGSGGGGSGGVGDGVVAKNAEHIITANDFDADFAPLSKPDHESFFLNNSQISHDESGEEVSTSLPPTPPLLMGDLNSGVDVTRVNALEDPKRKKGLGNYAIWSSSASEASDFNS